MEYVVLARKHRPQTLSGLVGQNVVCETLRQIFRDERVPHAFVLYGIRGVGKTTIARILSKGLNCHSAVTVDPCGTCVSCIGILEGRHLDVVEMDAASRTSVDDIREIIESSRYKPVQGRYKIFIIDEVHMLSKNAFNALLKTLEEPPPHVKFIFATTEIRKIPDTILSRCARLELRRIEPKILLDHLLHILEKEGEKAEISALKTLTRVSEGSLRDALSLLDQALSLSKASKSEILQESTVRLMLGSVDKDLVFSIIDALSKGETEKVLSLAQHHFCQGLDPLLFLQDILDVIYNITCFQHISTSSHALYTDDDMARIQVFAQSLPPSFLLRAWNVLILGYHEVDKSPSPFQSLEMLLVRLCFLKTLPPLEDLLLTQKEPQKSYPTFEACLSALEKTEPLLAQNAKIWLRLISYQEGKLIVCVEEEASPDFITALQKGLTHLTKTPWEIDRRSEGGMAPLSQAKRTIETKRQHDILNTPVVQDALRHFPGAEVSFLDKGSV